MRKSLTILVFIVMFILVEKYSWKNLDKVSNHIRAKRQMGTDIKVDSLLSLAQHNNLTWRKELHREISGLQNKHNCATLCLLDSFKCNMFQTSASGNCLIGKLETKSNETQNQVKESIKFLYGDKPRASIQEMRYQNFANVSPQRLCIAICLLMENCLYSSIQNQLCNAIILDPNDSKTQVNLLKDAPGTQFWLPTIFGIKISHTNWILCQSYYCVFGEKNRSAKMLNALIMNKGLMMRERLTLKHWKDWSPFSVDSTGDNMFSNMNKKEGENALGLWSEWTTCSNDCAASDFRSRTRPCPTNSMGGPMKCKPGANETESSSCNSATIVSTMIKGEYIRTALNPETAINVQFADNCGNHCDETFTTLTTFLSPEGHLMSANCKGKILRNLQYVSVTTDTVLFWILEYVRTFMSDGSYYNCNYGERGMPETGTIGIIPCNLYNKM